MVTAAVCQPLAASPPYCVACCVLIEMEWLRIELGAKRLDSLLVDLQPTGAKRLADGKVFEISASHFQKLISFTNENARP